MITEKYLRETEFFDSSTIEISKFVEKYAPAGNSTTRERVVKLYYAVRDQLFYDIYGADFSREGLTASQILRGGSGMCIHKSIVYTTVLRTIGVPARLWFADVKNHLCSENIRQYVGGDTFYYHCLVEMCLDGKNWIKSTPVFNDKLCTLYKLAPLEFDGTKDSLHHPYDLEGQKHMEFVNIHGDFDDLPYHWLVRGIQDKHPNLFLDGNKMRKGSLISDASEIQDSRTTPETHAALKKKDVFLNINPIV